MRCDAALEALDDDHASATTGTRPGQAAQLGGVGRYAPVRKTRSPAVRLAAEVVVVAGQAGALGLAAMARQQRASVTAGEHWMNGDQPAGIEDADLTRQHLHLDAASLRPIRASVWPARTGANKGGCGPPI